MGKETALISATSQPELARVGVGVPARSAITSLYQVLLYLVAHLPRVAAQLHLGAAAAVSISRCPSSAPFV